MIKRVRDLYIKHKEIINYLIAGGLTTVVSLGVYFILVSTICNPKKVVELQVANVISWIAAVLFAYFINRSFVFESKTKGAEMITEIVRFFGARVGTLLMDMGIMHLGTITLDLDDKLVKLFVQVVVTVANYIISKFMVFKKNKKIIKE